MSLLLGAGRTPCLGPLNVLSLLPRRWAGYQLCPAAEAVSRGGTPGPGVRAGRCRGARML